MSKSTTVGKLARYLSFSLTFILVLLPFHALLSTWAGSNFGHLDVWRVWKEFIVLALLPLVAWLVYLSPVARKWLISSWVGRLFGLYVLLHVVLGAWALKNGNVNFTAFIYAFIINLRFIGFFIICSVVSSHSDFLKRQWQNILLVPASVVILFGILQKFALPYDFLRHFGYSPKTILAYQTVDANLDFRRIQSTLRGANPLGAYLVLIIPALLASARKARSSKMIDLALALVVLFYTYSRSAVVGVGLTLLALIWLGGRKLKSKRLSAGILAVLVIAGGSIYYLRSNQVAQDTLFHTSSSSTSQSSNSARLKSIEDGVRDVIHQPLGRGPGTAGPASFRNKHPVRIAENYFLQIGQEVGIIGLGLFITINFLVGKGLWLRRDDRLAKILLASLVGVTFINLVSHAWTDDTLAYIWWGLAGVALAENGGKTGSRAGQPEPTSEWI